MTNLKDRIFNAFATRKRKVILALLVIATAVSLTYTVNPMLFRGTVGVANSKLWVNEPAVVPSACNDQAYKFYFGPNSRQNKPGYTHITPDKLNSSSYFKDKLGEFVGDTICFEVSSKLEMTGWDLDYILFGLPGSTDKSVKIFIYGLGQEKPEVVKNFSTLNGQLVSNLRINSDETYIMGQKFKSIHFSISGLNFTSNTGTPIYIHADDTRKVSYDIRNNSFQGMGKALELKTNNNLNATPSFIRNNEFISDNNIGDKSVVDISSSKFTYIRNNVFSRTNNNGHHLRVSNYSKNDEKHSTIVDNNLFISLGYQKNTTDYAKVAFVSDRDPDNFRNGAPQLRVNNNTFLCKDQSKCSLDVIFLVRRQLHGFRVEIFSNILSNKIKLAYSRNARSSESGCRSKIFLNAFNYSYGFHQDSIDMNCSSKAASRFISGYPHILPTGFNLTTAELSSIISSKNLKVLLDKIDNPQLNKLVDTSFDIAFFFGQSVPTNLANVFTSFNSATISIPRSINGVDFTSPRIDSSLFPGAIQISSLTPTGTIESPPLPTRILRSNTEFAVVPYGTRKEPYHIPATTPQVSSRLLMFASIADVKNLDITVFKPTEINSLENFSLDKVIFNPLETGSGSAIECGRTCFELNQSNSNSSQYTTVTIKQNINLNIGVTYFISSVFTKKDGTNEPYDRLVLTDKWIPYSSSITLNDYLTHLLIIPNNYAASIAEDDVYTDSTVPLQIKVINPIPPTTSSEPFQISPIVVNGKYRLSWLTNIEARCELYDQITKIYNPAATAAETIFNFELNYTRNQTYNLKIKCSTSESAHTSTSEKKVFLSTGPVTTPEVDETDQGDSDCDEAVSDCDDLIPDPEVDETDLCEEEDCEVDAPPGGPNDLSAPALTFITPLIPFVSTSYDIDTNAVNTLTSLKWTSTLEVDQKISTNQEIKFWSNSTGTFKAYIQSKLPSEANWVTEATLHTNKSTTEQFQQIAATGLNSPVVLNWNKNCSATTNCSTLSERTYQAVVQFTPSATGSKQYNYVLPLSIKPKVLGKILTSCTTNVVPRGTITCTGEIPESLRTTVTDFKVKLNTMTTFQACTISNQKDLRCTLTAPAEPGTYTVQASSNSTTPPIASEDIAQVIVSSSSSLISVTGPVTIQAGLMAPIQIKLEPSTEYISVTARVTSSNGYSRSIFYKCHKSLTAFECPEKLEPKITDDQLNLTWDTSEVVPGTYTVTAFARTNNDQEAVSATTDINVTRGTCSTYFVDVNANSPLCDALEYVRAKGIFYGRVTPNGRVADLGQPLLRAEFFAIAARLYEKDSFTAFTYGRQNLDFVDLNPSIVNSPANRFWVEAVIALDGIVTGYGDGTLRPARPLSMAELAKVVGLSTNFIGYFNQNIAPWYADILDQYAYAGITFNPESVATRADAVMLIYDTDKLAQDLYYFDTGYLNDNFNSTQTNLFNELNQRSSGLFGNQF